MAQFVNKSNNLSLMSFKIFDPFVFQGNLKSKKYFEGWYFKHTSADQQHTWSFIPGVSLNDKDPHCFIQVVDGIKGFSDYVRYPLKDFSFDDKKRQILVHKSIFSENFIDLDLGSCKKEITGRIEYAGVVAYPKKLLSPGIMGWYSFVPFMECKHGVISADHNLSGSLSFNGIPVSFDKGKGYIEKDWGTSFPEAWIWIQSNNFSPGNTSFFFSIAKIPWLGSFFMGFICYLYLNKKFYSFCTYNGSKVTSVRQDKNMIMITLENKKHILKINSYRNSHTELKAPSMGEMTRKIKESINSEVSLKLHGADGTLLFEGTGRSAGLEVVEKIFEYL